MPLRRVLCCLFFLLLAVGCGRVQEPTEPESFIYTNTIPSQAPEDAPPSPIPEAGEEGEEEIKPSSFIREEADKLLLQMDIDEMVPLGQVKTLYRYIIETTYFSDPVGLDLWWYLGEEKNPPSYTENRAISPLIYGLGSCEDYAAALVILLQQVGFEAEYVAGYTISVDGDYVDHAWAVVRLEDSWYHIDPQLEQNVTRNGLLTYRYFLKSDEDLVINHKWGENLIDFWPDISEEDAQFIREEYLVPACPQTYPPQEADIVELPSRPNILEIMEDIDAVKQASARGRFPEMALNTDPPVLISGQTNRE